MPLWQFVVGVTMIVSLTEIVLALRLDLAPRVRTVLIASAVVTPFLMLAIFRFVMPEAGAIPIS